MDWELEAIVRGGCNNELASSSSTIGHDDQFDQYYQPFGFGSFGFQQDMLLNFPDICETSIIFDELEDLYKPFYPQAILTSTTSMSAPTAQVAKPKKLDKQQQQPPPTPLLCGDNSTVGGGDADHVAKPKKSRKNQPKRVVHQATADGLSTDMWAWRKYGQKPIKGSPYPRSYYRCSSSKGCPARKQVERSSSDPGLLVMTYSGEHNHTHPKRRSSLAGSSRPRSSIITTRSATNGSTKHVTRDLPPPPVTSTVDELGHQQTIKKEGGEGEEIENLTSDDIIFNDECFPSLEDLEGSLLGQFPGEDFSEPNWFINESAAGHGGS